MSPRPRRNEQNVNLQAAIQETAWKQIAEYGAAALSLRAIARDLGITAPAIYNYFPDRDALVTALIIDAYTSFGDSQIAARDAIPAGNLAGRMLAIGLAYRNWALTHPQRYLLIFGTPIPAYEAPLETVLPSAARSLSALVSVVDGLRAAGKLNVESFPEVQSNFKHSFEMWKKFGGDYDILSLSVAVLIWARVHGIVSLEISGNLPPFGADGSDLYLYEMRAIEKQFVKA
ncbi:MAG: TetR/AcrR family transcriptional regulator [Chloroflexi bacterium]|nr:MAG: TetR/AcrR family transcriptional regulator [Chloroflexota bacterium]